MLEAGRPFRRLGLERATVERLRDSRVLFDPRLIRAAFPAMQVRRTGDLYLVNGIGVGGTTPMATGNGIRADGAIRALGIDLDPEFDQISREIHRPPPTRPAGTRPPGGCSRPAPSWTSTRGPSPR